MKNSERWLPDGHGTSPRKTLINPILTLAWGGYYCSSPGGQHRHSVEPHGVEVTIEEEFTQISLINVISS